MPTIKRLKTIKETVQVGGRWYLIRGFRCKRKDGEPDGAILGHLVDGKLIPGAPPGEDSDGSGDTDQVVKRTNRSPRRGNRRDRDSS